MAPNSAEVLGLSSATGVSLSSGCPLLEKRAVIHGLIVHDEPGDIRDGSSGFVNDFP